MTVNAHTHLYSGLVPLGMPAPEREPRDFREILERIWWRLDRALDERSLRAAARYYLGEAKRLGTTAVIDHHESPNFIEGSLDVLADACEEFGIGAVLCYGATERNGGMAEARRGLRECRRFILSNRRPGISGMVGLHAAFTVSDETIREAVDLCRDLGVPLHVHVAEDRIDETGFSRLLANGALIPGSVFAHGVHLTRQQVQLCDAAGVWLVQNPRSNRNNRVGYPRHLAIASHVALGTDGFPSDLASEADVLRQCGEPEAEIVRRVRGGGKLIEQLLRDVSPLRATAGRGEQKGERLAPTASSPLPATAGRGWREAPGEGPVSRMHSPVFSQDSPLTPGPSPRTAGRGEPDGESLEEANRLWEKMKCID